MVPVLPGRLKYRALLLRGFGLKRRLPHPLLTSSIREEEQAAYGPSVFAPAPSAERMRC